MEKMHHSDEYSKQFSPKARWCPLKLENISWTNLFFKGEKVIATAKELIHHCLKHCGRVKSCENKYQKVKLLDSNPE